MKVSIEIPMKLLGYNQLKTTGNKRADRTRWGIKKQWQHSALLVITADWTGCYRLQTMGNIISNKSAPITFSIEYHQVKGYDEDNALLGANKLIIDPLVRQEILPDDTPRYITLGTAVHIKCKKGEEKVIAIFETGEE